MFLRLPITYKSIVSISLFSLAIFSGQLCAEVVQDKPIRPKSTTLDGLAGTFPARVRYAINQLKKADYALKSGQALSKATFKNRLLLYGPPGNGKTVMAEKIATQAGAHYIYVNTPELVDKYQGKTAAAVKAKFVEMHEYANKNNQPVVIVFDEIDALLPKVEPEQKREFFAISQELCHQLDTVKDDARIFFIGLTNEEELHATLKTVFHCNIEKISAPNADVRREVLQLYKEKYTGAPWNEEILKELVKNSEDRRISIRFLEDYVREVVLVAKNETNGVISDELARNIFYEMKAKYVESYCQFIKRKMVNLVSAN